jgi:cyclopropane fatty-acyl-phospholipid synthase-like methyltransferase
VFMSRNLPISAGKTLLEIGCGIGVATVCAALQGAQCTATDINPAAVENVLLNAEKHHVSSNVKGVLGAWKDS